MNDVGQSAQRKRRFFLEHPMCCFCGGDATATTIDHVPSIQLFKLRERPAGLEFPACLICNNGTSVHELVAAMLARSYPSGSSDAEQAENKKLFQAIENNRPGLLREMLPSWQQEYDFDKAQLRLPSIGGALNASGPLLNESIHIFAVKLCLAIHYEITGFVVPPNGAVAVWWYSNFQDMQGKIPDVSSLFTNIGTLKQGKKSVEDQFQYAYSRTNEPEPPGSAIEATFRYSFSVRGFVVHDRNLFVGRQTTNIWEPGFRRIFMPDVSNNLSPGRDL